MLYEVISELKDLVALSNWGGKWQGWKNKSNAFRSNCFLGTVPSTQAPKLAIKTQGKSRSHWSDCPLTPVSEKAMKNNTFGNIGVLFTCLNKQGQVGSYHGQWDRPSARPAQRAVP